MFKRQFEVIIWNKWCLLINTSILHTKCHHILQSKILNYDVLESKFNMNLSRICEIMALDQKYQILLHLSFNVIYL